MEHISSSDLERYHLGMVKESAELAQLEEHVIGCPECAERAEECASYVDAMRVAMVKGDYDLVMPTRWAQR